MINYTVKAKKNPVDASVKFYPQIGKQKATDLEEIAKEISGQSENSVAILLSGYSFVSLRHETMASITDSIS